MSDADPKDGKLPAVSEKEIVDQLEQLPEDQRQQILAKAVVQLSRTEVSLFSGPLPPAEELARYEDALPGSADRIVTMAEKEQEIRAQQVADSPKTQRLVVKLSTVVAAMLMALAGLALWIGEPFVAIPFGLVGFAGLFLRSVVGILKNLLGRQ